MVRFLLEKVNEGNDTTPFFYPFRQRDPKNLFVPHFLGRERPPLVFVAGAWREYREAPGKPFSGDKNSRNKKPVPRAGQGPRNRLRSRSQQQPLETSSCLQL
ncbi:MAG: hypothetical protein BGO99_14360 [Nitrosospira sp. 56-18]|nr:MAG: hypothetical protein BGO99_14360 [Nitrosospira sp. 56-18]